MNHPYLNLNFSEKNFLYDPPLVSPFNKRLKNTLGVFVLFVFVNYFFLRQLQNYVTFLENLNTMYEFIYKVHITFVKVKGRYET